MLTPRSSGSALAAVDGVDLGAGLERLAGGDALGQVYVAGLLGHADARGHALALGLVVGDEGLVALAEVVQRVELLGAVALPGVRTLH